MKRLAQKISTSIAGIAGAMQLATTQVMAQRTQNILGGSGTIEKPTGFADNVGSLLNAVLSFVMVVAALLVLMYLIWGGIEWITSGGDKGKTESARNKITAAVIGLIVLAAAYAIFMLVIRFLGFSDMNELFTVRTISG